MPGPNCRHKSDSWQTFESQWMIIIVPCLDHHHSYLPFVWREWIERRNVDHQDECSMLDEDILPYPVFLLLLPPAAPASLSPHSSPTSSSSSPGSVGISPILAAQITYQAVRGEDWTRWNNYALENSHFPWVQLRSKHLMTSGCYTSLLCQSQRQTCISITPSYN